MSNDEYRRWWELQTEGCSGHAPFNENIYGMIVIWEITKDDADRFKLPDTEALALAGEWALERLRPYFSLFREEKIAGENASRDHVYSNFTDTNSAFKKEVRLRLLEALRTANFVENARIFFCAYRDFFLQKNFRQSAVSFHIARSRLHGASPFIITNGICTKASSRFTIKNTSAAAATNKHLAVAKN